MPKIAAQSAHTPLHLAFSVYAFGSDGRFLAWVGCDAQKPAASA
jgi:isopentenyldiphosphate isomerase